MNIRSLNACPTTWKILHRTSAICSVRKFRYCRAAKSRAVTNTISASEGLTFANVGRRKSFQRFWIVRDGRTELHRPRLARH